MSTNNDQDARIEHLRSEIRSCDEAIEKGGADNWWHIDRDRFRTELRQLTEPAPMTSNPETAGVEPVELLPCPFCGGAAERTPDPGEVNVPFGLVVDHRAGCFLSFAFLGTDEAIDASWNARTPPTTPAMDSVTKCPFCGEEPIPDATEEGHVEHPDFGNDCALTDSLIRPDQWRRRAAFRAEAMGDSDGPIHRLAT